jgi:hypothetical protein
MLYSRKLILMISNSDSNRIVLVGSGSRGSTSVLKCGGGSGRSFPKTRARASIILDIFMFIDFIKLIYWRTLPS